MSDEFFDTIFFCGGIGFLEAERELSKRSEDCIYIGDQI